MVYKSPIQAVWPDVKFLQGLSRLMRFFHTEPIFEFKEEGMNLLTMDASHVSMMDLKLPKEYFKVYKLLDGPVKVAFNPQDFYRSLITAKSSKNAIGEARMSLGRFGESVELWLTRPGYPTKKRSIPQWKDGGTEIPTPKIFFKSKLRCDLSDIYDMLLDLKSMNSQQFRIKANASRWEFSSIKDKRFDKIYSTTEFHKDDDWVLDCKIEPNDKEHEAAYTLEFIINLLTPFRGFADIVALEMSSNMPIKIDVEIPQGTLAFYVAPCIGV